MAGLTEKNKRAIEVYLGAGSQEAKGSGTKAWQEVYGTKDANTAAKNWSRMVKNGKAQEYLERRRQEIEVAVQEKVAFDADKAVQDLIEIQNEARQNADFNAAVKATVEAGRFAGIYVTKSESESLTQQVSPEDRQMAAHYEMGLSEYMSRKAQGTLPPAPEGPRRQH